MHLSLRIVGGVVLLWFCAPALAYIGPGAGISFVGSLFTTLIVGVLTIAAVLFWPVRYMVRRLRKSSSSEIKEN